MTIFPFRPCPAYGKGESILTYWENEFSDEDIQNIIKIGENAKIADSVIFGQNIDHDYRKSQNSWIHLTDETIWLFETIGNIIRRMNSEVYNFDLFGFTEALQYTIYDGNNDHYEWHIDSHSQIDTSMISSPRKLSFSLQLSDPSEYEGGDILIKTGKDEEVIKKEKGFMVMFPSFVLHKVTPVTKGVRKSLVGWVSGPAFR